MSAPAVGEPFQMHVSNHTTCRHTWNTYGPQAYRRTIAEVVNRVDRTGSRYFVYDEAGEGYVIEWDGGSWREIPNNYGGQNKK